MGTPLTGKRAAFVREYQADRNATQAAIRAGYSARTADRQGSRLLRNVEVSRAIEEAERRAAARAEVVLADVLRGLKHEAETAKTDGVRVRAWELLGKHLGMFNERPEPQLSERAILEQVDKIFFSGWTQQEIDDFADTGAFPPGKTLLAE